MPKDANGRPLKVDDVVMMQFKVTHVDLGVDKDQVALMAIDPDGQGGYMPRVECESRLVELAPPRKPLELDLTMKRDSGFMVLSTDSRPPADA